MEQLSIDKDRFHPYFKGDNVPDKLKELATLIMTRFSITGLCDKMDICNKIAYVSGIGDGNGHFTGDTVSYFEKIAVELQSYYRHNIFKEDLNELEDILKTGKLDTEKTVKGLENYIQKCREEQETCNSWIYDYLSECILEAENTLREIQNPKDMTKPPLQENKEISDVLSFEGMQNLLGRSEKDLPPYIKMVCEGGEVLEAVLSSPKVLEEAYEMGGGYLDFEEPIWSIYHDTPEDAILFTHGEEEFLVSMLSEFNDIIALYPSTKDDFLMAFAKEHYGNYSPDMEYPKEDECFLSFLLENPFGREMVL